VKAVDEDEGAGRRGGRLRALTGFLNLAGGSNRAGNDEALEIGESRSYDRLVDENKKLKEQNSELKHKVQNPTRWGSVSQAGGTNVYELGEARGSVKKLSPKGPMKKGEEEGDDHISPAVSDVIGQLVEEEVQKKCSGIISKSNCKGASSMKARLKVEKKAQLAHMAAKKKVVALVKKKKMKKTSKKTVAKQKKQTRSGKAVRISQAKLSTTFKATLRRAHDFFAGNYLKALKHPMFRRIAKKYRAAARARVCSSMLVNVNQRVDWLTKKSKLKKARDYCSGAGVSYQIVKWSIRPVFDSTTKSKELDVSVVCGLMNPKLARRLKNYALQKGGMTSTQLKRELMKIETKPNMFVGIKIMCCTSKACITAKKCTDMSSKLCVAL